jgi:ankyrin repeat protein
VSAQAPAKVDFAHDVQPILRQNCVRCHGPAKQNGGLRLDRRSSALKDISRRIVPGNSANSMVYHRVSDTQFGAPMPPEKPLRADQIAILKNWIDQGAVWPSSLANEVDLPPFNPEAIAAVEMLRNNALPDFLKTVSAKPALLNARGPEGSTPFMYAVLYADTPTLDRLLKMGANPHAHNDANATALMWAAHDYDKTALLIAHGADVNARSADFRTPLMIAARKPGGKPIVKLLLDHGANPNPSDHPEVQSSPLLEAATAGDLPTFELLMQRGAKVQADGEPILVMAITTQCYRCAEDAAPKITDKAVYTGALEDTGYLDEPNVIRFLLDHGADPQGYDVFGHTALMYAASSDILSLDAVKLLVSRGADVNARSRHSNSGDAGLSVLDMARRHGKTPVVDFLVASGAKESGITPVAVHWRFKNEIHGAIRDSIPLLQRADVNFAKNSGCVSCHNNNLTAMTVGLVRKQGLGVDEKTAAAQLRVNSDSLAKSRDILHQGFLSPTEDIFGDNVVSYMLLGMHAEGYKPDLSTDAAAMFLLSRQKPNGEWPYPHADTRQPLCLDFIGNTALDMRALQLYAPKTDAATYSKSIQLASAWLANAQSYNNEDRSWRVIGLAWANTNKPALQKAMQELKVTQKQDGGWSDLPSMESSAYATGKSLVALHTAGMPVSDPVYQRGMKWLLSHQSDDGSWYVQSRALAFQPWSDAGFPHGYDQFISSAATNWAAMALTLALPDNKNEVASRIP